MLAALVGACCGRPPPSTPAAVSPPLAGRARTVTFECPGAEPRPEEFTATCADWDWRWTDVDPQPPSPWVHRRLPSEPPGPRPCHSGLSICRMQMEAPEGSRALGCRDSEGRRHGPIEVVAPDGSLLVQGFCAAGVPVGLWLWWHHGALSLTRSFTREGELSEGLEYRKPGRYRYPGFRLVPVVRGGSR